MEKPTLAIDSQQLSSYQKCPRRFLYEFIWQLEPKLKKKALNKGIAMAQALENYYNSKKDGKPFQECVLNGLNAISSMELEDTRDESAVAQRLSLITTFSQYCTYYRTENFWPLACEVGFSKRLFEDENVLLIYEGRPDIVFLESRSSILSFPADHKTESKRSDLHGFSNQFLGYGWGLESDKLLINYIGFQTSLPPEEKFRRDLVRYSKADLYDWTASAIYWSNRMLKDIQESQKRPELEKTIFVKNRANCSTKYGLCVFAPLCDTQVEFKQNVLKDQLYKIRETPWSAWKNAPIQDEEPSGS